MIERQISLEGLPEPMAQAIEIMVASARELARRNVKPGGALPKLPVWKLGAKAPLHREDYYVDAIWS
jgi:hypothetical protein